MIDLMVSRLIREKGTQPGDNHRTLVGLSTNAATVQPIFLSINVDELTKGVVRESTVGHPTITGEVFRARAEL